MNGQIWMNFFANKNIVVKNNLFGCFVHTISHYVAQAGLEFDTLLSLTP
jgi:hypothetical protein